MFAWKFICSYSEVGVTIISVFVGPKLQRCAGHPNTPFFFGAIFNGKSSLPSLVMSLHTVGGSPFTLQSLLHHSTIILSMRGSVHFYCWVSI